MRHRLESPALTIIGRVVSLRPPPLFGRPVLVMRPEHQAGRLSDLLSQKGARVTECPILGIVPIRPNPRLDRAERILGEYDWIVLTSGNTVRLLKAILTNPRRRARLAAIGPGTAESLRSIGLRADLVPKQDFHAEGLAETMIRRNRAPQRILLPQAEDARAILGRMLKRARHAVFAIPVYRTQFLRSHIGKIGRWANTAGPGLVPLTSASMARAFAMASAKIQIGRLRLVSIGPVTTKAARRAGLPVHAESPESTLESLVETLETVA